MQSICDNVVGHKFVSVAHFGYLLFSIFHFPFCVFLFVIWQHGLQSVCGGHFFSYYPFLSIVFLLFCLVFIFIVFNIHCIGLGI